MRPEHAVHAAEPSPIGLAPDHDEHAVIREGPAEVRQPAIAADVEDCVVAVLGVGEVFARVVDHMVGTDGPDQVHLRSAAYAGDFGAEGLGDLHGEGAHASRSADD